MHRAYLFEFVGAAGKNVKKLGTLFSKIVRVCFTQISRQQIKSEENEVSLEENV